MPTIEPPASLLTTQKWFSSIITRPIDSDSQMNSISPMGRLMSEEAKEFITPNLKLSSEQRIQIYNQQYWWRLLATLHQNFPTLTRLFGYSDFNLSIGMPYISRYPSRNWSLSQLGDQLPAWVDQYYVGDDKPLILFSAEVDWAYQSLFFAPTPIFFKPSIDLISKKLKLQPHLKLFTLPFDVFSLRTAFLKEKVEYWTESPFPELLRERNYFFVLFRSHNNHIIYKEVEEGEWMLLKSIHDGLTIEEACDTLENKGGKACLEAEASLDVWIQQWINQKWLIPY